MATETDDAPNSCAYWKLINEYGRTPAQAQGIITSGARFCDACGKNYPIAVADILRDEYTRCCPLCTLTDILRNGDGITQSQARAMLDAMDADAAGPESDDRGPDAPSDAVAALRGVVPWLTLLGDYIGNGTTEQPEGRCNALGAVHDALRAAGADVPNGLPK